MKTKIKTETMKDLTKYYIDLSKCTEQQRKSLPQILEKAGETFGESIDFENMDCSFWTNFHKPDYATYWTCGTSNSTPDKTELTYPEFIKLFEGGDGEKEMQPPLFMNKYGNRYPETNMTEPFAQSLKQIEKLKADKAELLEALEIANNVIMECDWTENEGSPHLIPIYEHNQSLIQKMKQ